MPAQLFNAVVAIGLGTVVSVLLFVPVAAYQYRRDGELSPRDLTVLVSAAVYSVALWTYTLLPLPDRGSFRCRVPQTELFGTIEDIGGPADGLQVLLRDPVLQQVLLNVLLFVPFGVLVRLVLQRGVLASTVAGFSVSLLIELTQRTGVWGFFGCAYRKFDVDDLLVNTLGALVGALLALPLREQRDQPRPLPTRITWGRRMVGMVCDGLFVLLVGGLVAGLWRGLMLFVLDTSPHRDVQWVLQWTVPFAIEAVLVLGRGRTFGELVVAVTTRTDRRGWTAPARLLKLAAGVGPVYLLVMVPPQVPGREWLLAAYLVLTVVATTVPDHRGLSHTVAGLRLEVEGRSLRRASSRSPAGRAS
ncbi:VanZ family protein [Nocardioides sp.]|uniref:VanZ family protein n=1 Tax=Nocardioides sp. TaxID=35761 RepID=UPI00260CC267|nr:VanZ family protein [Nocardioides sp.]